MNDTQFDFENIRSRESELQLLLDHCGKPELSHGLRLLSIYVALYKKSFGDLPRNSYEKILSASIVDDELAKIFENGMREAISILDLILRSQAQPDSRPGTVTLN